MGLREQLENFPTTNAKIILGILMFVIFTIVVVVLMARGVNLSEGIIAIIYGAIMGFSIDGTVQKVKKWQNLPDSGKEDPPLEAERAEG